MSTRRDFLKRTLVVGVAFGLGLWRGLDQAGQGDRWELAARLPAGEEDALWELAGHLGVTPDGCRRRPLGDAPGADLVLLRNGRLLEPAAWPAAALALRRRWAGRPATQWVDLRQEGSQARRALILGPQGHVASLDLGRNGEHVFHGRDGRRVALSVQDGGLAVVEAACRHRHCLRQGRVSLAGERLVCAPAGLLVELEA
jgi:hypothetical protein